MDMETTSDPIDSIEHTVAFSSSASERKKAVRAALELEGLPAKRLAGLIVRARLRPTAGRAGSEWNAVLDDALRKTSPAHAIECIGELAADARGSQCALCVRVACAIVCDHIDPPQPWLEIALVTIAQLLESGGRTGCRARALEGAVRRVERMLCAHRAALVPLAVRVVTSGDSFCALPAVARACIHESEHKATLLDHYVSRVYGKQRVAADQLDAFTPLLLSLSENEVDDLLRSTVTKLLKKNPETMLEAAAALVEAVRFDLSAHLLDGFMPTISRQLRSATDDTRAHSARLLGALSLRCGDADVFHGLIKELGAVLAGKSGILSQWYQKHGIVCGLAELLRGAAQHGAEQRASLADAAGTALVPVVQKESHEETRQLACSTLGKWMLHSAASTALPSAVEAALRAGLTNQKVAATPLLSALNEMTSAREATSAAKLEGLADTLAALVETAQKRPQASHPDAVVALCVWLRVGQACATVRSAVAASLKPGLAVAHPFLFSPLLLTSADARTVAALRALCELLAHAATAYGQAQPLFVGPDATRKAVLQSTVPIACASLVECLLHASRPVREAAAKCVAESCTLNKLVCVNLCKALRCIVSEQAAAQAAAVAKHTLPSSETDAGEGTPAGHETSASRLGRALLTIMPEAALPDITLPDVMLLCHHPVLCISRKRAKQFWAAAINRLDASVENILDKPLVSTRLKETWLQAACAERISDRDGAVWAAEALASVAPAGMAFIKVTLVPELVSHLTTTELTALSEADISAFLGDDTDVHAPQARSARTTKPAPANEDEAWDEQVRAEIAAKRAAAGTAPEAAKKPGPANRKGAPRTKGQGDGADRRGPTAEEKIGKLKQRAVASLWTISRLCSTCPLAMRDTLFDVHPAVSALLSHRLVQTEARAALEGLCGCLDHSVPASAATTASVYCELASQGLLGPTKGGTLSPAIKPCPPIAANYFELLSQEADASPPWSDATFDVLFPLVHAMVTTSSTPQAREDALAVLSARTDLHAPRIRARRKQAIEAVLLALNGPSHRMRVSPESILVRLCENPALNTSEWGPLLGAQGMLGEVHVRLACLRAMSRMAASGHSFATNPLLESRLWLCCHDPDDAVKAVANEIWTVTGLELSPTYAPPLLALLSNPAEHARQAAAQAIAAAMTTHTSTASATAKQLCELFTSCVPTTKKMTEAERIEASLFEKPSSNGGSKHSVNAAVSDEAAWMARSGVALALEACGRGGALDAASGDLSLVLPFILEKGLTDKDDTVRPQMRAAGIGLIEGFAAEHLDTLLPILENEMERKPTKGMSESELERFDWRQQGAVVFLGTTAKQLPKDDPKIMTTVERLGAALMTPSESVQRSVADCMAPLIAKMRAQAGPLLDEYLAKATTGKTYGDRRGAAYGLSAVVKGLGIAALKQHNVMGTLEEACKGTTIAGKQGALFAFECLVARLGLLFEPYVIVILPLLLKACSDASDHVRDAAQGTARVVMANLTAHGVKLVLPKMLEALEDSAWRTKQAAIQLLGAMAYCAPRQLSSCLPQIVPRLTSAFSDTHPKVQAAGRAALQDIGLVVRNPEVSQLLPTIMVALSDPAKQTKSALDALLACEFMHSIDAPSLALLIPVLQRGLRDRVADVKRKAALITGNMCSMISGAKDLLPYLPAVMPGLQNVLLDPIPDVRSTSAKALSSLMRGLGEENLPELLPWLMDTLKSGPSSVERSGGAQGLAEVLVALDDERVDALIAELIPLHAHPKHEARRATPPSAATFRRRVLSRVQSLVRCERACSGYFAFLHGRWGHDTRRSSLMRCRQCLRACRTRLNPFARSRCARGRSWS